MSARQAVTTSKHHNGSKNIETVTLHSRSAASTALNGRATTTATTITANDKNNHNLLGEHEEDIKHDTTIDSASNVEEIYSCLSSLSAQESKINQSLKSLLALQSDLSRELSRLDLIRARLGTQVVTARGLASGMLSSAATTATRVFSAVKKLDIEQGRVKETLAVVESVVELKACVLGVVESMGDAQDWEKAAVYLDRASKVPEDIIKSDFAEEIVPTAEVPDPPSVTLHNAAESLCGLFLREFEKATKAVDGERVTRFFKLFPLIGRSDTGLDVYGKYVCGGVVQKARANLSKSREGAMFYASVLSQLFEYTANIVEQHSPLVEKHYGLGRMVRVIERLQVEVDTQGGIIIDTFWDERSIQKKLSEIQSYPYSFLLQSFVPNPSRTGTPGPKNEDEGVDIKEIDQNLHELGVMLSRWSLYCRYIARKCQTSDSSTTLSSPSVITNSNLLTRVDARLSTPFESMTTFFFRRSVEKAFQLDEQPPDLHLHPTKPLSSNAPYITSAVDDVMYILNKLLKRATSTCSRSLVVKVISSSRRILESDFIGLVQRKLRDERNYIAVNNPPDDKVISFCILMNNLDTASEYTQRIIDSLVNPSEESEKLTTLFPFDDDATVIKNALMAVATSLDQRCTEILKEGISILFSHVLRPRMRLIVSESFRDVEYNISGTNSNINMNNSSNNNNNNNAASGNNSGYYDPSEDPLSDPTLNTDTVVSRFTSAYHALTHPFKRIMTPATYDKLLFILAKDLNNKLEKRIRSYAGGGRMNELGAIHVERDVTGIIGAVVREGKYGLRELFERVVQICLVLNMEEDEVEEMMREENRLELVNGVNGGGEDALGDVDWKLSREERRSVRALLSRD